ncbi:RNA polymerase sigma factor [Paraburkholderia bryophila]|jgi:RNA polymerase sigma-70 factor (ECF subfamily)|uniref:RNA polymerase sigma-70 factor (ECF subfamily) n=1 Tax=Paraburkholderia bryophila TaxID=420952 RepID=A0A329CNC8_9BURK|nr:sigma-70 family RNA polymerase sigma factor [Paraburkholderia bryophila]RAS35282.1 RNA polymerase sigma-70 factor (ECF subfamily) [Paraburkholderia bryophila]
MPQHASTEVSLCAPALDDRSVYLAALLKRIARRDAVAFEALYRLSAPSLFGLAVRVTRTSESAEDVVQDGFIKIWRFAGSYDPDKASPSTWMSTIVKNQALDYLRRNPYAGVYVEELDERVASGDGDLSQQVALDAERLSVYLGRLTPGQRQAIALAYFRGQSQSEIAHTLDAPIGTVKSWISRGLESLRSMADPRRARGGGGVY